MNEELCSPLSPRLRLELSSLPEELWVRAAYAGLGEEYGGTGPAKWPLEDVGTLEAMSPAQRRRAVKGHLAPTVAAPPPEPPTSRRRSTKRDARLRKRRVSPGLRYVRRHALDPFLDARLSRGACRTLVYLIARCGKKRMWSAPTCWVAEDLACHERSIQRHYKALEEAGYIGRSSPDKRGRTTVIIRDAAEAPPWRKKTPDSEAFFDGESATKVSDTQTMKVDIQEDTGDALSGTLDQCETKSPEPGAELPRPAQPLAQALVEPMNPESLREGESDQRLGATGEGASDKSEAERGAFERRIAELRSAVLRHASISEETAQEAPPPPTARVGADRRPLPPLGNVARLRVQPVAEAGPSPLDALIARLRPEIDAEDGRRQARPEKM